MKKVLKVIGIILLVIAVLFAGVFVYAFFNGRSGMRKHEKVQEGDVKIACVGDSITYGSQVSNWPENNYPKLLGEYMGEGYNVRNYGVSGACLQDTCDKPYSTLPQYEESLAYQPDIVIIMLGTNDTKVGNWEGVEAYTERLREFLEIYQNCGSNPQIYLCTPAKAYYVDGKTEGPMGYNICGPEVDEVAAAVREVAEEYQIPLIDVYALTAEHSEWFVKDGIHPNKDGAKAIAELVYNTIKE